MAEDPEGMRPASPQSNRYLTDYCLFLCAAGTATTGILMWIGPRGMFGRGVLQNVHVSFAIFFLTVFCIHFAQHWKWIGAATARRFKGAPITQGPLLILALTLLVGGAVSATYYYGIPQRIERWARGPEPPRGNREGGFPGGFPGGGFEGFRGPQGGGDRPRGEGFDDRQGRDRGEARESQGERRGGAPEATETRGMEEVFDDTDGRTTLVPETPTTSTAAAP